MKKAPKPKRARVDRDTLRPEYDFSKGVRGVTARRYAEGAKVIVPRPARRRTQR